LVYYAVYRNYSRLDIIHRIENTLGNLNDFYLLYIL